MEAALALVDAVRAYTGAHTSACREGVRSAFEGDRTKSTGSVDASIRSTSSRLSETHAQLRTAESSADTSLARLEETALVSGKREEVRAAHGEWLARLREHRCAASSKALSLLESLQTELETIEAEARREAEEEDAKHEARLKEAMSLSSS